MHMAAQGASSRPGKQRVGGPIRSGNLAFGGIGGWYPERRPEGPGDARQQFGDALEMMKESLERLVFSYILLRTRTSTQNTNFNPNCMIRGSPWFACVLVIRPNEALFTPVAGLAKFTWLKILKNSARNWTPMSSLTRTFLLNPISK